MYFCFAPFLNCANTVRAKLQEIMNFAKQMYEQISCCFAPHTRVPYFAKITARARNNKFCKTNVRVNLCIFCSFSSQTRLEQNMKKYSILPSKCSNIFPAGLHSSVGAQAWLQQNKKGIINFDQKYARKFLAVWFPSCTTQAWLEKTSRNNIIFQTYV